MGATNVAACASFHCHDDVDTLLAGFALVIGIAGVALAVGLEVLVVHHWTIAHEPSSYIVWLRPSAYDLVVAVAALGGVIVDAIIAATGWSVVRRGLLRRRGALVFILAFFAHFLVAWAIGERPAPYTVWAIFYELVGMAAVIVGWVLAVSTPK